MSPTIAPTFAANEDTLQPTTGHNNSVHSSVPRADGFENWQLILVIVAGGLAGVGLTCFHFHLACKTSEKEDVGTTVDDDLKMEETTSKREIVYE